ncbi:MAG: fused MFS/spermidine synthase, partial [Chloroflexi bacterium]|nr:fused MFS/spermidine synthase [Chloroflexota bacterium]
MRGELSKNSMGLTALITSINPYVVVFGASACGLIIEIVAGRILAPSIGVSLYTWTAIIGVVLAGISVGSYVGGLVADRFPSPVTLGLILLAAGVSSLTVLLLIEWIPALFGSMPVVARIIFMTTTLFFLPSLILGMVTPVVIKLRLKNLTSVGNVVGRFYAVSTAGSIFGTFVTGFVLIQWIGVRSTILLVALTLLFMALAFGELWRAKRVTALAMALFLGIGGLGFADGAFTSDCLRESNYYCIRVTDTITERGYEAKALHLDKLIHSYVSPDDPSILFGGYNLIFGELANLKAQQDPALRMLFIGGGGYTLPRYVEQRYPQSILEVAEIDPEVRKL